MNKILVIVDMQNDFINIGGALMVPNADKACDNVVRKIRNWDGDSIICTYDTHLQEHYLNTEEGKNIPIHCVYKTWGWELHEFIYQASVEYMFSRDESLFLTIEKDTFGAIDELPAAIEEACPENPFEIHICGLCTDICVISNALILRSAFPYAKIVVDASCCAGTTKENHLAALKVMKANCIEVENMEVSNE